MKRFLIAMFFLSLAACHDQLVGNPEHNIAKARVACRDGVEYLASSNAYGDSFTVHMRSDGRPFTCAGN